MHSSKYFQALLISFVLGIFLGSFIIVSYWISICMIVIGVALFILLGWRGLNISWEKRSPIVFFGICLIMFSFGLIRINSSFISQRTLSEALNTFEYQNVKFDVNQEFVIRGYITREPALLQNRQDLVLEAKHWEINGLVIDLNEKILIQTDLYPQHSYGDKVEMIGTLALPKNRDSNDFDYVSYLAKDGIYSIARYPDIQPTNLHNLSYTQRSKIAIFSKIFLIKKSFESSINRSVSEPNAAFLNGILVGSRANLPQDLKDDFAITGTTHILAISGYNITIIAVIVSWVFLFFFKRKLAFWFTVAGVIAFTILTGAQASVVRAAIMGILVLFARREGRMSDPMNMLLFAGAIMLLVNPMILRFDVGFQLSFMATLGLVYGSPRIERFFAKVPSFFELRETLIMTLSAQLFVLPILIYHFGTLSLASLPVNLLVLPLVPYAMLLGFATGILGMILPIFGIIAGYGAWLFTMIEIAIIRFFADWGWASFALEASWYWVPLMYLLLYVIFKKLGAKEEG